MVCGIRLYLDSSPSAYLIHSIIVLFDMVLIHIFTYTMWLSVAVSKEIEIYSVLNISSYAFLNMLINTHSYHIMFQNRARLLQSYLHFVFI